MRNKLLSTLALSFVSVAVGLASEIGLLRVRFAPIAPEGLRGGADCYCLTTTQCPADPNSPSCSQSICEQVPDPDGGGGVVYQCQNEAGFYIAAANQQPPNCVNNPPPNAQGNVGSLPTTPICGYLYACICTPNNNSPPLMSCAPASQGQPKSINACQPNPGTNGCEILDLADARRRLPVRLFEIARYNGCFFDIGASWRKNVPS